MEITDKDFIETIFEIAFGDNAVNKSYTKKEVLNQLMEFSNKALYVDQCILEENDYAYEKYVFWLDNES